eukprot:CAMPEP_0116928716 /NCGR_PEP_ID=MMETSP0467-20121206/26138_1 /TAXON_ID=283647 /ORGANISM="Mesodinium pulex, Strain SPMC105" /LENGTH=80 /DNA_ID=CAMNT_0004608521 /DNA_START=695 /DNA_END=937 /DNA_ORIENTATION=+
MREIGMNAFVGFTGQSNVLKNSMNNFDEMLTMFYENIDSFPKEDYSKNEGEGLDVELKVRMVDGKTMSRKFSSKAQLTEV